MSFNSSIVIGLLSILFSTPIFACSCSMGSTKDAFNTSDSVFTGRVKSVEYLNSANVFGDRNIIVHFENPTIFKGDDQPVLHTAHNGSGCTGYWFKEGEEYLVYAFDRGDGLLDTMWCGGVRAKSKSDKHFNKEMKKVIKLAKKANKRKKKD
jgi:hypothetical protein